MKEFEISGVIVSNDDAEIYDWFGIENTAPRALKEFLTDAGGDDVTITINSGGGDLYSGVNMHDALRAYDGDVEIHISGLAASAASIIAMAGRCLMSPGSNMMIHNAAMEDYADKNGKVKTAKELTVADRGIAAVYEAKSGKSEEEMLKLMDKETWLDAKTALELGLVDGILGAQEPDEDDDEEPENAQIINARVNILPKGVVEKARTMLTTEKQKKVAPIVNDKVVNKGIPIEMLERNLNLLRR